MHSVPLRFGLFGFGPWGAKHARAIAAAPRASLAVIADPDPSRLAAARAAHPDAELVDDWRKVVSRPDVDAVDVVVPTALHFELACAAIEANKHVLVDGPMVARLRQSDELIARACEQETMLAVGHHLRMVGLWAKLKELVDGDAVGQPEYVQFQLKSLGPALLVTDEATHCFDLARWFLSRRGDPTSVYARTCAGEGGETFTARVGYAGVLGPEDGRSQDQSRADIACIVAGTDGVICAEGQPACELHHVGRDGVEQVLPVPASDGVDPLERLVTALVQQIREGRSPTVAGVDGRWAVRIALAAQESLRRGEPVRIREIG
jgi:myo-inositol 2-dehydrogenase/D-chiro-inositol 1-dehydrogenase